MSVLHEKYKLLIAAAGIFVCYFYFGIMQEKITRGRYGTEVNEDGTVGERFTFTLALVAVQCIFNWIFAKGEYSNRLIVAHYYEPRHLFPFKKYFILISNFVLHFSNSYRATSVK